MSYSSAPAQSVQGQGNFLGQVKWFNAKAGFGYITVMEGDRKGEDVFVHHSAINVSDRMYKYLVQGEYVGFAIGKSQKRIDTTLISTSNCLFRHHARGERRQRAPTTLIMCVQSGRRLER